MTIFYTESSVRTARLTQELEPKSLAYNMSFNYINQL